MLQTLGSTCDASNCSEVSPHSFEARKESTLVSSELDEIDVVAVQAAQKPVKLNVGHLACVRSLSMPRVTARSSDNGEKLEKSLTIALSCERL